MNESEEMKENKEQTDQSIEMNAPEKGKSAIQMMAIYHWP